MASSALITCMMEGMATTGVCSFDTCNVTEFSTEPATSVCCTLSISIKTNEACLNCRVDINMDCTPAAASDIYNMQDCTGGLDSQGFGLSSQSSTDTAFQPVSDAADSPGTGSAFPFNQQVSWGCQPFAGVGKRPLVSPGSSPVKQKPRVCTSSVCCPTCHLMTNGMSLSAVSSTTCLPHSCYGYIFYVTSRKCVDKAGFAAQNSSASVHIVLLSSRSSESQQVPLAKLRQQHRLHSHCKLAASC